MLTLKFIGACYTSRTTTNASKSEAHAALMENNPPRTGFTVQALLLFALGLTFYGERDEGRAVLDTAVDLALDLGMNWNSFTIMHGEGCRVLEESWWRTWWGLYIADAFLAANFNSPSFKLWTTDTNVGLSCEEMDYASAASSNSSIFTFGNTLNAL